MRLKTLTKDGSILGTIKYADEQMSASSFGLNSAERSGSNDQVVRHPTTRSEVQAAIKEYRGRALFARLSHVSLRRTAVPQQTGLSRGSRGTDGAAPRHRRASRTCPPYEGESEPQFSMRTLLGELTAVNPLEDDTNRYEENEFFFPSPKTTFIIDRPQLKCSICRVNPLEMLISPRSARDKDTTILPCGHAACHGCLSKWLEMHSTCPFCRVEHRHRECGHAVAPRTISQKSILSLPPTTCKGGKVAARCSDCRRNELYAAARRYAQAFAEISTSAKSNELARAQLKQTRSSFLRLADDPEVANSHQLW